VDSLVKWRNFDLTHFWKAFDAFPAVICSEGLRRINRWHVQRWQFERALSGRRFLENQAFALPRVS